MTQNKLMKVLVLAVLFVCSESSGFLMAAENKDVKVEHAIHVDIPVVLKQANVVFNMDHLAFAGDLPVGINYMHLLANRFKETGTTGNIIGIFHGDAAYLTLNVR